MKKKASISARLRSKYPGFFGGKIARARRNQDISTADYDAKVRGNAGQLEYFKADDGWNVIVITPTGHHTSGSPYAPPERTFRRWGGYDVKLKAHGASSTRAADDAKDPLDAHASAIQMLMRYGYSHRSATKFMKPLDEWIDKHPTARNKSRNSRPACGVQFVGVGSGAPVDVAIPCRNKGPMQAKLRQLQADVRSFEKLKRHNTAEIYRYLVLAVKAKSGADALHLVHKADALKDMWMGAGVARGEVHDEIQAVRRLVMAHWKAASPARNKRRDLSAAWNSMSPHLHGLLGSFVGHGEDDVWVPFRAKNWAEKLLSKGLVSRTSKGYVLTDFGRRLHAWAIEHGKIRAVSYKRRR